MKSLYDFVNNDIRRISDVFEQTVDGYWKLHTNSSFG